MAAEWPILVFYDGACPLCSREMRYYRELDVHHHLHAVDIAAPGFDASKFGFAAEDLNRVMHVKMADGRVYRRVAAFVKIWEAIPPRWWTVMLRGVLKIPGMIWIADLFYRAFAANRYRLTGRCAGGTCDVR